MTKVDIINKKEFTIENKGEIYKYIFKNELDLEDYMKNIKSSFKLLNISILEVDLDKLTEDIRNLYKEELILSLLRGNE